MGQESNVKADQLSKIMSAIDQLDKKINVRTVMDVFREFDNWMAEQEPAQAIQFTRWHKLFLQYRITLES